MSDEFEKAGEEFKKVLEQEMKSGESERKLVAQFLMDLMDDGESPDLMESSLNAIMDAAEHQLARLKELIPHQPLSEEEQGAGMKRFMVEYDIRFFNGTLIVAATDMEAAHTAVLESYGTRELTEPCPDTHVGVEAIYEIDNAGKEIPGTRKEFE